MPPGASSQKRSNDQVNVFSRRSGEVVHAKSCTSSCRWTTVRVPLPLSTSLIRTPVAPTT